MPDTVAEADSGPSSNSRSLPGNRSGDLTRKEVLGAWGDWLSRYQWDWWVTLTYDPKRSPNGRGGHTAVGWALSDRHWHEWLGEAVGDSIGQESILPSTYYVRGREPNPYRYGTHFHALIGGVPTATSRRDAWAWWFDRHGMARIEQYDPLRGAGWYVSKYVVKTLGDIQFSPNLSALSE